MDTMKTLLHSALCLLIGMAATGLQAREIVFQNEYDSSFKGFPVTSTRTLYDLGDGRYLLSLEASNFVASLKEKSWFRKTEKGGYQSQRHEYKQRVFGFKREQQTRFDWQAKEVTFSDKDGKKTLELHEGMTDRMLYQYLMEEDLRQGVEELSYEVVDKGRLRNFTFKRLDRESLQLDGRSLETVKLTRVTEDDKRETLVWFAPELDYRLVRILHTDGDDRYEMTLDG